MNRFISGLVCALSLGACTTTDEVVFVTKSSLSIVDIDSTPAEVSVGYQRVEGYFAPAYENGAIPPVVASIQTDGSLFSPRIRQIYATGDAANILASNTRDYNLINDTTAVLEGDKRGMFFGTSTTLGFKVGVTRESPSITIGYKRKEASYIPLGTKDGKDQYPSVLASIDTTINAGSVTSPNPDGLQVGQYFATGTAAKYLASKSYMQAAFKDRAQNAFQAYENQLNQQNSTALGILRCAASLTDQQWPFVFQNAVAGQLLSGTGDVITQKWQAYIDQPTIAARQQALKFYYSAISIVDGAEPTYLAVLQAHQNLVCKLAKETNHARS
jgi:hypothetical protein